MRARIAVHVKGGDVELVAKEMRVGRKPFVKLNLANSGSGSRRTLFNWRGRGYEVIQIIMMIRASDLDAVDKYAQRHACTLVQVSLPEYWSKYLRGIYGPKLPPRPKPKPVITFNPDGTMRYQRAAR